MFVNMNNKKRQQIDPKQMQKNSSIIVFGQDTHAQFICMLIVQICLILVKYTYQRAFVTWVSLL